MYTTLEELLLTIFRIIFSTSFYHTIRRIMALDSQYLEFLSMFLSRAYCNVFAHAAAAAALSLAPLALTLAIWIFLHARDFER